MKILSNYILKVSSFIYQRKNKLRTTTNSFSLLWNAILIVTAEIYLGIVSLPTYLFVSENELKKKGFDKEGIRTYKLRKRISVSTLSLAIVGVGIRLGVLALTSVWLGRYLGVDAATANWDLAKGKEYVYSKSVQITDGLAVLKKGKKNETECEGYVYAKDPIQVSHLEGWNEFLEIADPGTGEIRYQISLDDGITWKYWNGTAWVDASAENVNTAQELSSNISSLGSENNAVTVKGILSGSCEGDVKLLDMGLSYDVKKVMLVNHTMDNKNEFSEGRVLNSGQVNVVKGAIGSGFELNGEKGGLRYQKDESLSPEVLTVSIWAKPAERKTATLVDRGGWKSNYTLGQDKWQGWKATIKVDGTVHALESGGSYWSEGEWHLITMTYDGSTMKLYVNEQLVQSKSVSGEIDFKDTAMYIGSEGNEKKFYNGVVDDFRLYNYALTASDISQLYSRFSGDNGGGEEPEEPELPAEVIFDLDEGSGAVASDTKSEYEVSLEGTQWVEGADNYGIYSPSYTTSKIKGEIPYVDPNGMVMSFWVKQDSEAWSTMLKLISESNENRYYQGHTLLRDYPVGEWHNVIISLQDGQAETYVNGTKVSGTQTGYQADFVKFELKGYQVAFDQITFVNGELTADLVEELSGEFTFPTLYQIIGTLENVAFLNESNVPITETEGYVGIYKNAKKVAQFDVNADLVTSVLAVETGEQKNLLHIEDSEGIENVRLSIQKSDAESTVRICPEVEELVQIEEGCSNEVLLSIDTPSIGVYTLQTDDDNYWYVTSAQSVFSAGIEEITPVVIIPELELTTPNEGRYVSGSSVSISWTQADTSGVFDLQYSADGFTNQVESIETEIGSTSYNWLIPEGINGSVQLRVVDNQSPTVSDTSNGYLIISDPLPDTEIRWRFDQSSCPSLDDSQSYPAVLGESCDTSSKTPIFTSEGYLNNGYLFDGSSQIEVSNSDVLNPTSGLTLSAWVRWSSEPTSGDSWANIINKNGDNQYQLQHNRENTRFEFALKTENTRRFITSTTSPDQGEWYLVTATYDGSLMKLYVNGELESQLGISGDIVYSESPIYFGNQTDRTRYFEGTIDEVRYYNYALDQGDIVSMYHQDSNRVPVVNISDIEFEGDVTVIDYSIADENNDFVSISEAQYSLDEGENWLDMTPESLDERFSGDSGLLADEDGEEYKFVWNTAYDLDNNFEDVQVRIVVNDGTLESEEQISSLFSIDTKAPVVSDLSIDQILEDGQVSISFGVEEDSTESLEMGLLLSDDLGNSWDIELSNVTGDIGTVDQKETYSIIWDVAEDYPDVENIDLQARLQIQDEYGNSADHFSSLFSIDTKSPFGVSNFEARVNAEYSVLLTWNSVEQEENFKEYEIKYSTTSEGIENLSDYELIEHYSLKDIATNMYLISELEANTQYYFQLTATDLYGNSITLPIVSAETLKEIDIESIVISADAEITNERLVTVQGVSVPNEFVTLVINDDEFENWVLADEFGFFEKTVEFLEGEYAISVFYDDVARKIDSNSLNIVIDLTAPQVSTLDLDSGSGDGYVVISGQAEPSTEITVFVDDSILELATIETDVEGNWSQEIFVSEDLYEKVLVVTVHDLAGNESVVSSPVVLPSFAVEEVEEDIIDQEGDIATGQIGGAIQDFDIGDIITESISDQVFTYDVSRLIDTPEVLSVNQNNTTGNIVFGGKGIPNSEVILFVHSEEAFAVKAAVDERGYWSYTHSPEQLRLEDGEHEVYAVSVDENSEIRSNTSEIFGFSVHLTPLILVLGYINLPTTIIALGVLIFAVFLVVYSRNKFNTKENGKSK